MLAGNGTVAMSKMQDILASVLPERWAASMEAESREWVMRCPCGHETSIWDMGGIRFKAAGNAHRMGKCGACGGRFWGKVYKRSDAGPVNAQVARTRPSNGETVSAAPAQPADRAPSLLWIDGVGCWMLCLEPVVSIGGPGGPRDRQDAGEIRLLADLSRRHVTIRRTGEAYLLEARGPAAVNGQPVAGPVALKDHDRIELGRGVLLRFRTPNPLSATARIEFESGHRPPRRIDGIVLLDQVCLLGPTADCHVVCSEWEQQVVVFRRDRKLWCKSAAELHVNGCRVEREAPVRDGTTVTGPELRFRVEFAGINLG
jgi:hypothetical protein